jgi:DNA-binding transcriptional MerR regulator
VTQQLFLISDVARRLNVPPHRVAYLFMTRKLPEPQLRLGNRRIFTLADLQRIAKALGCPVGEQEAK